MCIIISSLRIVIGIISGTVKASRNVKVVVDRGVNGNAYAHAIMIS